jgi:hypothetical protein
MTNNVWCQNSSWLTDTIRFYPPFGEMGFRRCARPGFPVGSWQVATKTTAFICQAFAVSPPRTSALSVIVRKETAFI